MLDSAYVAGWRPHPVSNFDFHHRQASFLPLL